jgi:hypothetical protein
MRGQCQTNPGIPRTKACASLLTENRQERH